MKTNFEIQRSKWRSGGDGDNKLGEGETQMLNIEGFMCCLGQIAIALGIESSNLYQKAGPSSCNIDIPFLTMPSQADNPKQKYIANSLATDAMQINDNEYYSLEKREERLKKLFAEKGLTLKFID